MRPVVKIAIVALPAAAAVIGLGIYSSRSSLSKRDLAAVVVPKSIAVLPFENLSPDPSDAYLVDGIQEEILTGLAGVADLKVISRTSTQDYQSKPRNLSQMAKQLGVANILEGSVQKAGDRVRISVQLINAQTDSQLWAETFDRKATDIFGVESEIAKGIAESLQTDYPPTPTASAWGEIGGREFKAPTPTASAWGDTGGREFKATTPIWPAQTTPHRGTKFSLPKSRGLIPPPTSTVSPWWNSSERGATSPPP